VYRKLVNKVAYLPADAAFLSGLLNHPPYCSPVTKEKISPLLFLVLLLVVVLPMAPLGLLRTCLCTVVLSTSPSHHHSYSPSDGRYQSGCVVFVAMLETAQCFHISIQA
jgi:hypothetical protein